MSAAIGAFDAPIVSSASVADANGITLTVTTKQSTYPVLKSATLLVESVNSGITFSATNGTWTVVTPGRYEIAAEIGHATGGNAKTVHFLIRKNSTTQLGNKSTRVEPATAAGQGQAGCRAVADLVAGDVVTVCGDSEADGDTIVVRQANVTVRRLGS